MATQWQGSNRRDRLPANWNTLRQRVHRRDGSRCKVYLSDGTQCNAPAVDVDHIQRGDDHSLENLRCICDYHHKAKSAQEGGRAYQAKMRKSKAKFRREEMHPGLL